MKTKLQQKIERQQRKQDMLFGNYSVGQKKSTTRRVYSKGNLWNHQNLPRIKSDISVWYK